MATNPAPPLCLCGTVARINPVTGAHYTTPALRDTLRALAAGKQK